MIPSFMVLWRIFFKHCFDISVQNMGGGCSLKPPHGGFSSQHQQPMFWAKIRKHPCQTHSSFYKVGYKGCLEHGFLTYWLGFSSGEGVVRTPTKKWSVCLTPTQEFPVRTFIEAHTIHGYWFMYMHFRQDMTERLQEWLWCDSGQATKSNQM